MSEPLDRLRELPQLARNMVKLCAEKMYPRGDDYPLADSRAGDLLMEMSFGMDALLQRVADAERQPEVITVWDLETQNAIGDFGERDIFDLLRRLAQYADLERAAREAQDLADARAESNTAYVLTVRKHYLAGVECLHEQKQDVARCGYGDWQSEPQASVGDAVDRWMDHVADELDAALRALGGEPPPPSEPNRYVHSGACGGQPAGSPCICGVGFPDYRDTLDQAPVEPKETLDDPETLGRASQQFGFRP